MFKNTLPLLFAKRLRDNVPAVASIIDVVDWSNVFNTMKSLGSHCIVCVFKTYVNAWTTSRRFHEPLITTCILGCTAEDNLAHYLERPRLWKAIKAATKEPTGATITERLGIAGATKQRLQDLAIAFTIYHTVKHGESKVSSKALRTRNFLPLAVVVKSIACSAASSFVRIGCCIGRAS